MVTLVGLLALLAMACGHSSALPHGATALPTDVPPPLTANAAPYDDAGRPLRQTGPPQPATTQTAAASPVRLARPRRVALQKGRSRCPAAVGRRHVALRRARLDNALRLLAHAGGFNVVVDGALRGLVSLDLKNVEPFDALVVVARNHGAQVHCGKHAVLVAARTTRNGMARVSQ